MDVLNIAKVGFKKDDLTFLTKYSILSKATSENEASIPGYLYNEINAITYENDGLYCGLLLDYLLPKLQKGSINVKLKVLKLLLYLIENGHHFFKKELRKKDYIIKEASCVHGPPDPLCGNEPYLVIKSTAKDVLDALFNENVSQDSASLTSTSESSKISLTGYGANAAIGNMLGFGNTSQQSSSVGERMAKSFSTIMDKLLLSEEKNPKIQNEHLSKGLPQYQPVTIENNKLGDITENITLESQQDDVKIFQYSKQKTHKTYTPGKAGGGWDDNEYGLNIERKELLTESQPSNSSNISTDSLDKTEAVILVDWLEEQKIVEQFTHPMATFPPTSAEIIETRKNCSLLNCDKIIELLVQKFQSPQENVKMRSLVLIETLLHHDIVSIEMITKTVLKELRNLLNHEADGPVKVKSKKLALIIQKLNNYQNA